MNKLEQIYQRFLEEVNRPEKRKKELTAQWHELNDLEEQAKEAFAQAEGKGQDSSKLFDEYQKVIRERKLTEARLEVDVEIDAKDIAEELKEAALEEYERLQCYLEDKTEELEKLQPPILDALADIVEIQNSIQHTKELLYNEAKRFTTLPAEFRVTYQRPLNEYLIDLEMVETHRVGRKGSK